MTVDTGARDKTIGCVVLQEQSDGPMQRIGYWSLSSNDAKRRYDTTHRECLAAVSELQLLRPYLEWERFTIRTYHASLRCIPYLADATAKLARWCLRLADMNYDVVHSASVT